MKLYILFLLSLLSPIHCSNTEYKLRNDLFTNYSNEVRPVENIKNSLELQVGLAIQNLEEFNQIKETIALNIWVRMNWRDYNLEWDATDYDNITFIAVDKNTIWTPDLELLNAANLPEIYTLQGGSMLYNTGEIMWSNPGVYKFSCSLDLKLFPFDTQKCSMSFGSWTYSDKYINLIPNTDHKKRVDLLDSFSHSEWEVISADVNLLNSSKDCCPNENFPYLKYDINLRRYSHYYKLNMGMTISLVIVSFIIILMEPDNVSRTGTAVFIPLTILALELTLANKIPVVGYYTLLDKFFVCCFVTSMICSIESGIIYALMQTKSKFIYNFIGKFIDYENTNNLTRNISYEGAITNQTLIQKIVEHKLIKTINHDDKKLNMTDRELHINNIIQKYCINIDIFFRIAFPIIFFSYIGSIYSNDK